MLTLICCRYATPSALCAATPAPYAMLRHIRCLRHRLLRCRHTSCFFRHMLVCYTLYAMLPLPPIRLFTPFLPRCFHAAMPLIISAFVYAAGAIAATPPPYAIRHLHLRRALRRLRFSPSDMGANNAVGLLMMAMLRHYATPLRLRRRHAR